MDLCLSQTFQPKRSNRLKFKFDGVGTGSRRLTAASNQSQVRLLLMWQGMRWHALQRWQRQGDDEAMTWRKEVARGSTGEGGARLKKRRSSFFFREQQGAISPASRRRKLAGARQRIRPEARVVETQQRAAVAAATTRGRGRRWRQFSAQCRKLQQGCSRLQQPLRSLRGFGKRAKASEKVWQRPQGVGEGPNQPAEPGLQQGGGRPFGVADGLKKVDAGR